jgi:regulator of cell morphogenesis and NO signaling
MSRLDVTDPIVDWVIEYPHAVPLFEQHGIDYTCGGKSLQYACEQRGVDAQRVVCEILNQIDEELG